MPFINIGPYGNSNASGNLEHEKNEAERQAELERIRQLSREDFLNNIENWSYDDVLQYFLTNPDIFSSAEMDAILTHKEKYNYSGVMDAMKKAGINPTMAFRSSLGSQSLSGSNVSNFLNEETQKEAQKDRDLQREQNSQQFFMNLVRLVGVGIIGMLIAL